MRRRVRTHPVEIEEMFDWNDPTHYQWVIRGRGSPNRILHAVGPVIGVGLIIPLISYLLAYGAFFFLAFIFGLVVSVIGIERFGEIGKLIFTFKLWLGNGVTIILLVSTAYLFWLRLRGAPKKKMQAESNLDELLTSSIGIMAFVISELARFGFVGSVDSPRQWLGFLVHHALRGVTLDFSEVLDLHLSDIQPHTWYAQLATVFFRFLIAAGLVNSLWLAYRRRFHHETISGTVKECFWYCQNMLDRDTVELQREGKVELFGHSERSVAVLDFIEGLDEQDFKEGRAKERT